MILAFREEHQGRLGEIACMTSMRGVPEPLPHVYLKDADSVQSIPETAPMLELALTEYLQPRRTCRFPSGALANSHTGLRTLGSVAISRSLCAQQT